MFCHVRKTRHNQAFSILSHSGICINDKIIKNYMSTQCLVTDWKWQGTGTITRYVTKLIEISTHYSTS